MTEFKTNIMNACRDGDFLNTVYEMSRKDNNVREEIINELIVLNNNLEIDVVFEFKKLKNNDEYGNFLLLGVYLKKYYRK